MDDAGRRNGWTESGRWFLNAIVRTSPEIKRTFASAVRAMSGTVFEISNADPPVQAVERSHDVRRTFGALIRAAAVLRQNATVEESWRRSFAALDVDRRLALDVRPAPAVVPECLAGPCHPSRTSGP